jgi:hypothetical protein
LTTIEEELNKKYREEDEEGEDRRRAKKVKFLKKGEYRFIDSKD